MPDLRTFTMAGGAALALASAASWNRSPKHSNHAPRTYAAVALDELAAEQHAAAGDSLCGSAISGWCPAVW